MFSSFWILFFVQNFIKFTRGFLSNFHYLPYAQVTEKKTYFFQKSGLKVLDNSKFFSEADYLDCYQIPFFQSTSKVFVSGLGFDGVPYLAFTFDTTDTTTGYMFLELSESLTIKSNIISEGVKGEFVTHFRFKGASYLFTIEEKKLLEHLEDSFNKKIFTAYDFIDLKCANDDDTEIVCIAIYDGRDSDGFIYGDPENFEVAEIGEIISRPYDLIKAFGKFMWCIFGESNIQCKIFDFQDGVMKNVVTLTFDIACNKDEFYYFIKPFGSSTAFVGCYTNKSIKGKKIYSNLYNGEWKYNYADIQAKMSPGDLIDVAIFGFNTALIYKYNKATGSFVFSTHNEKNEGEELAFTLDSEDYTFSFDLFKTFELSDSINPLKFTSPTIKLDISSDSCKVRKYSDLSKVEKDTVLQPTDILLLETSNDMEKCDVKYFLGNSKISYSVHIFIKYECGDKCLTCLGPGNQDSHKCATCRNGFFLDNGNCKVGCRSDQYVYEAQCYDEIPIGYYVLKSDDKNLLKCLFSCGKVNLLKERLFCERTDIIHNCKTKNEIDEDLDLNTNIIKKNLQAIDKFVKSSKEEKQNILTETSENLVEIIKTNLTQGLEKSILLNQLLDSDAEKDDKEIEKYHSENLKIIQDSLTCDSIKEMYKENINGTFLTPSMTVYYSFLNKEKYFTEKDFDEIQKLSACIFESGFENMMNVHEGLATDFFSISASSSNKMINVLNNLKHRDDDFNETKFETNATYKYSKAILNLDSAKETKKLIEEVSKISSLYDGNQSFLSYNNLDFIALSFDNLKNKDFFNKGLYITFSSCENNQALQTEAESMKYTVKICLPYEAIKAAYPNAFLISLVKYKSYPLLNPNVTDDISKEFNTLIIRDENNEEIKIKNLSTPIKMVFKKQKPSQNVCIFYNDEKNNLDSEDCKSEIINDNYILCSCNHLTDFSLSQYDPIKLIKDVLTLFSQARFIKDFGAFSILNAENATVLYIISIIIFIYLGLFAYLLWFDMKNQDDLFVIFTKKGEEKCCQDEEKEEEIEELGTKMHAWVPETGLLEEENKVHQEIELENFDHETQSNQTLATNQNTEAKKQSSISCCSLLKIHFMLYREFFKKDYWLCTFFNDEREMTKINILTIFVSHLIAALGVCSIFAECGMAEEVLAKSFNNRDLAVSVSTILLLEIPFTIFEVLLTKTKLTEEDRPNIKSHRIKALIRYIIIYVILFGIIMFCTINTTWISLDSIKNDRGCRFLDDFFVSAIFDNFIYQFIILFIKALIYLILLRGNKSSCLRASLFCFVSSLPWIFNLQN